MKSNLRWILFLLVVLLFGWNNAAGQNEIKHYEGKEFTVDYSLTNGMLNGKYLSCYKNGHKKAEGNFQFNNRVGKWDVYDSTGKLQAERVYTNAYEYTQVVPAIPDGPAKLLSAPLYIPTRNAEGFYKYYALQQRAVIWRTRTWAYIFNKDNPILCDSNRLFKMCYKQILNHTISAYKCKKDLDKSFIDTIDFSKTPLDTSSLEVIGFIMKGDWFIDNDRNIMEYRVLGICPMVKGESVRQNKKLPGDGFDSVHTNFCLKNIEEWTKDTVGLFWIYYPQIRKYLAEQKVDVSEAPYIKNLDDVFFWKYYSESITGQVSVYGISQVNNWTARLTMIEWEQDVWTGLGYY